MEHVSVRRATVPNHLLACPACGGDFTGEVHMLACGRCGETYRHGEKGRQWDLRLRQRKSYTIDYDPAAAVDPRSDRFAPDIVAHPNPAIAEWRDARLEEDILYGNRLTRELLSHFPKASGPDQWMLDLGCGPRQFESICTSLTGFNYVGVDYGGAAPDLLADAHALPFRDASFDFILSIAVLEHLSHPDMAMAEALRVLKPGGTFVGTVAFLEPFHMDSHYHMTHLGTHRALRQAGFEVVVIAPNAHWTGLRAQAEMALFPGLRPALQRAMVAPAQAASTLFERAKRTLRRRRPAPDRVRAFEATGGFRFVARRALSCSQWGRRTGTGSSPGPMKGEKMAKLLCRLGLHKWHVREITRRRDVILICSRCRGATSKKLRF